MHEHPARLGIGDGTVVADKSAATTLVINANLVQGDVDCVGRAVVMRLQTRLLVRTVAHYEVHQRAGWLFFEVEN